MLGCYLSEFIVTKQMAKLLRYEVFTRLIQLSYLWTAQKPDSKNCDRNYQLQSFWLML